MSHEHELSKYQRNGNRVDLDMLLDMGRNYQDDTGWRPTNPSKNSGVPVKKDEGKVTPRRRPARARPASPSTEEEETSSNVATAIAEPEGTDPSAQNPVSDC